MTPVHDVGLASQRRAGCARSFADSRALSDWHGIDLDACRAKRVNRQMRATVALDRTDKHRREAAGNGAQDVKASQMAATVKRPR